MLNTIIDKLYNKEPFSFIRYGDGESLILNHEKNNGGADFIATKHFGYALSSKDYSAIKSMIVQAYDNADVWGLPTERHSSVSSAWKESKSIFNNSGVNGCRHVAIESIDTFYDWLKTDNYDILLTSRKVLNYISCRDLDEAFKKRFGIQKVNRYLIPPEMKFTSGTYMKHYPDAFDEVRIWIENNDDIKGNLCFVGAGFLGKIYSNWVKQKGGIVLDIGAVFDLWAGRVTRGPGRGMDIIDNSNKL